MHTYRTVFVLTLLFVLTAAPGSALAAPPESPSAAAPANGGDSPEEAFQLFLNAAIKDDWETAFKHMTAESRDFVATGMVARAVHDLGDGAKDAVHEFMDAEKFKALAPEITAAWSGGRDKQRDVIPKIAALLSEKDKPAVVKRVFAMLKDKRPEEAAESDFERMQMGTVAVNGDRATARTQVETPNGQREGPIAFRKIGDRWFVEFSQ